MKTGLKDLEDQQLLDKIRLEDQQAFEELMNRYSQKVFALAFGYARERETAKDLVQEIFLKIWKSIGKFRGASKVSTWIYSVAANHCRDFIRQTKKNVLLKEALVDNLKNQSLAPTPEDLANSAQLRELLWKALEKLPPSSKNILSARINKDETFKQTSASENISAGAARTSASRAYRQLREILNKYKKDFF
jgi:RNA polymerase sigma-70 factor, ECF subfamily